MPIKRRDLEAALSKKGFRSEEGGKHTIYHLVVDGQETAIGAMVQRGGHGAELRDQATAFVARDLNMSKRDLLRFVECSLSEADYCDLLREKGLLPPLPADDDPD